MARRPRQVRRFRSALERLLLSRRRRPRSSPRLRHRSPGRPCPRSRWMFLSPLRKCFASPLYLLCFCRLICLLDRVRFWNCQCGYLWDVYGHRQRVGGRGNYRRSYFPSRYDSLVMFRLCQLFCRSTELLTSSVLQHQRMLSTFHMMMMMNKRLQGTQGEGERL